MSDFLDSIKQKYSEEVGWTFSFFEGVTFFVYLTVTHEVLINNSPGVWKTILTKSAYDIVAGESSALATARVIDYIIAAILTIATIYSYRYICRCIYEYLSTLKDLNRYVEKLKLKYQKNIATSQAMRIYIANEAKEQKQLFMKQITALNGFGLVTLNVLVTSIIGLFTPNLTDSIVLIVSFITLLIIQWQVFTRYTSQVIPRLVLERLARGDEVIFGDEYQE